jgi:integrase
VADPEWQSLVRFGFYTGQRLGDLATLRRSNIDLVRGEIRFVTAKTGRRMIGHDSEAIHEHYVNVGRDALQKAAAVFPSI